VTGKGDGSGAGTGGAVRSRPEAWLEALQRFGMRPGLERISALLHALGHPEREMEVVLVAGTNGKGSVTALLHAMVREAGARAGRFVSPHLERFEERVTVDGGADDRAALHAALERVRPQALALGATYFEALTAVALTAFALRRVETAVLEVGMGGRWDATNATDPRLSVVTTVDLDHTEVLGATIAAIAADKAGVARPGRPLLTGAVSEALAVVRSEAARVGARLWALDDHPFTCRDLGWRGLQVELRVPSGATWALTTPLLGAHQGRNLALAAAAAELLGVTPEAARRAARRLEWPGRMEVLHARGRRWLLDGAHNPAGAAAAARTVRSLEPAGAAALVVGVSGDKDVAGVLGALQPVARAVVATRAAASARAAAPHELAAALEASDPTATVRVTERPEAALAAAEELTGPGDLVVVAGSLFLVGEIRTLLRGGSVDDAPRWQ
jgi:dihydrofolate synthase / folylpolyglutamate synthase